MMVNLESLCTYSSFKPRFWHLALFSKSCTQSIVPIKSFLEDISVLVVEPAYFISRVILWRNTEQIDFTTAMWGYRVNKNSGTVFDVSIMSSKAAKYQSLMPEKPKEDLSSKLISPMPGTVVSIDVAIGDMVSAGQSVAVVEAMKMQNGKSHSSSHLRT